MKKIYIFGNPLVPQDSFPFQFINELSRTFSEVDFQITDPNENFPPTCERNLVILDTVKAIKKPTLFDLDDFESKKTSPVSPHDYDLLFHLLLLRKLKKIDTVSIIGIPQNTRIAFTSVRSIIRKVLAQY